MVLASPPTRRLQAAAFLTAVAAAALISACGGEETTTTTTTTTATTTETTTTTQTTTVAPGGQDGGGTRSCGDVAFQPASDAGAFGIEATGVSCGTARAVAAAAEGAGDSYTARGFSCSGTEGGGELPSIDFTCKRDGSQITFSAS